MTAPSVPEFSGPLPLKTDLANYEANAQRFMSELPAVIEGINNVGLFMTENMPTVAQLAAAVSSADEDAAAAAQAASNANSSATTSTAQAGIATNQAGIATTKAQEAQTARDQAVAAAPFAAGTVMLFVQSTAPTGWTKSTTHNNKALRVVSGVAGSGGTVAFTTAFASKAVSGTVGDTTLSLSQIPSHRHGFIQQAGSQGSASGTQRYPLTELTDTQYYTDFQGGGGAHNHSFTGTAIDMAVQYVDVIIATKS